MISVRDALGRVTRFEYDAASRPSAVVRPLGQRAENQYDAAGNIVGLADFDGAQTSYTISARNQILRKQFPGGGAVDYTYLPSGQIGTVTDARGVSRFTYDAADRLVRRTEPDDTEIVYAYSAGGFVDAVTTPSGTTHYAHDAAGRIGTVTAPDGGVTTLSYDAVGNLIAIVHPNGVSESRSYDPLDRVTAVELRNGLGALLASYQYLYDGRNNVTRLTENGGRRVDYSYDDANRLVGEVIVDPQFGDRTITYTHDAVGNRLSRSDSIEGTTTYQYDANDRLVRSTLGGVDTDYTWDARGNLVQTSSPDRMVDMTWNAENRLTGAIIDDDGVVTTLGFAYDRNGLRVSRTVDGVETRFLIDELRPIPQVAEEYRPGGGPRLPHVYADQLLSQGLGTGRSYHHSDGRGSIRSLTGGAGTVSDRYAYDAFGRLLGASGTTPNDHRYRGERFDALLGQYDLRARGYDPDRGRFTAADPAAGTPLNPLSLNDYLYGNGNPVAFVDPMGTNSVIEISITQQILGGLTLAQFVFTLGSINGEWVTYKGDFYMESIQAAQFATSLGIASAGPGTALSFYQASTECAEIGLYKRETGIFKGIWAQYFTGFGAGFASIPINFSAGTLELKVPRLAFGFAGPYGSLAGGAFYIGGQASAFGLAAIAPAAAGAAGGAEAAAFAAYAEAPALAGPLAAGAFSVASSANGISRVHLGFGQGNSTGRLFATDISSSIYVGFSVPLPFTTERKPCR